MSNEVKTQGFEARSLLTNVVDAVVDELNGRKMTLPRKVLAEIADDSDHHRTRKGYTGYQEIALVQIGTQKWVVALGVACGSYPADPYNCDIAAVPIEIGSEDENTLIEVASKALRANSYFQNSLLFADARGALGVNTEGRFGKTVEDCLISTTSDFVAQSVEYEGDTFHLDTRPVASQPFLYKPEFVVFMTELLVRVLTDQR